MIQRSVIFIDRMRLYAYHGVMPQERQVGGWFIVSLRVHYNITRAIQTDCVDHTLNYADLSLLVENEMARPSQLLEHVVGRIANRVVEQYSEVTEVNIRLVKENPPMGVNCQGAGVELTITK